VGAPSKDFRENPLRAVHLLGRIDQQQVYRVTPDVLRLRGEGADPITVYIDSAGGETLFAEDIRSLLHCRIKTRRFAASSLW
jgi:ATP-dependent protease ClpP protease subunit